MKCSNCGEEIQIGEEFCSNCKMSLVKTISREIPDKGFTYHGPSGKYEESAGNPKSGVDPYLHNNAGTEPGLGTGSHPEIQMNPVPETGPDLGSGHDPGSDTSMGNEETGDKPDKPEKKKKWNTILLAVLGGALGCFLLLMILASVGGYTEEDAQALVQAELDSYLLDQYDDDFEFSNMTRDEASERRETMIQDWVDVKQEEEFFSDALRDRTGEMWDTAFRKTKYTVEKAVEKEDSSYQVRVEIKPLDIYSGMDGMYYRKLYDQMEQEHPEYYEEGADDTPYYDALWSSELDQIMNVNLKSPSYRSSEYCTIRVYEGEDGWLASADDLDTAINKMFYYGSRWDQLPQN